MTNKGKYKNYGKLLAYKAPSLGCDPEFFIVTKNRELVRGSEKFIPIDGIEVKSGNSSVGKIIMDGIQVEFTPQPRSCRQGLARIIARHFKELNEHLKKIGNFKISFKSAVKVSQKEMDSLSDASKIFGCSPSYNQYIEGKDKTSKINADPTKYLIRTGGGHIHIGTTSDKLLETLKDYDRLVPLLDLIVGNTCVLIDRDPYAKERRKNYGRAGEFRKPKHGIEYRTLSNFWVKDYVLMSFVMSLARLAVNLLFYSKFKNKRYISGQYRNIVYKDFYKELMGLVDIKDVKKAINNNDYELAKKNFLKIEDYLIEYTEGRFGVFPFKKERKIAFAYFVEKVKKNGLEYWFPDDPLETWINRVSRLGDGWERFIDKVDMKRKKMKKPWKRNKSWKNPKR